MIIWQDISEAESIVEHTEHHLHGTTCMFTEVDSQFVVVITCGFAFSPRLCPSLILRRAVDGSHLRIGSQFTTIEEKSQMRGGDKHSILVAHHIIRFVALHTDGHRHGSVG